MQMNKKKKKKLNEPKGHLISSDLSVEEKQALFSLMHRYGATSSMTYNRFFRDGFSAWEQKGINQILSEFCEEHNLTIPSDKSLWDAMPDRAGLKEAIYQRMEELGMSRHTTRKRFTQKDWKPWERIGINQIIQQYCNGYGKQIQES